MSGVTAVSSVGSKNVPPSACRLPPATTLAPPAIASAMCSSTFATASWSIIGPCVTPASVPGPTLSERTFAANFSANAS